jgi:predicted nucleic acid-binding protein
MRSTAPIYLDTNVLISLGDAGSAVGRLMPGIIALQNGAQTPLFLTSRLTFAELMVKPLRDRDRMMASIYTSWAMSSAWLSVCEVDGRVLELAPLLRAQRPRLKLPDAIHLASALVCRCERLLTADLALLDIPALDHPFLGPVDMEPLTILRPDEPSLSALLESISA